MEFEEFDNEYANEEIFGLRLARIVRSKQQVGEDTTKKRLVCDIEMSTGGIINDVPYTAGGIDLDTGNPHGLFVPPRRNMFVGVLFVRANYSNPVACFYIPHPSWEVTESNISKYNEIMEDLDDIILYHFSGTKIILRKDGFIEFNKKISGTDYKLKIEFNSAKKTFTISDTSTNNKIIFDEDGIQVKGKNGSNMKEAARKDDEVKCDATTDVAFESFRTAFNAWAAGLGLPTPMPASRTGKITKASDEVKISGASV